MHVPFITKYSYKKNYIVNSSLRKGMDGWNDNWRKSSLVELCAQICNASYHFVYKKK
jgi:hypothetical protein